MSYKDRIQPFLPVVLSVILPGLGLLSNRSVRLDGQEGVSLVYAWVLGSASLYGLWHLIWRIWSTPTRSRKALLILGVVGLMGVFLTLISLFVFEPTELVFYVFAFRMSLVTVLFIAIQYALKAQEGMARLQLEKEQIQSENYRAQLRAIRAQIDPHFLFNSLNTLRSMIRHQHRNSEDFVVNLSDFYRYTLKHNENNILPLHEELAVLESYLFVMKSRNPDTLFVEIEIGAALKDLYLPSLSLQVAVENCVKHNSMTAQSPLRIKIAPTADMQYLSIRNNLQDKVGLGIPSGRGLELLRKRYELLNISEGIHVRKTADSFELQLKLIER